MSNVENLESLVRNLYSSSPQQLRADWTDWLYRNHVFVVAANAKKIASLFHADPEVAFAGGMLHDIADATMKR